MARDDDDQPRDRTGAAKAHEIGQDLSLLSVAECDARIALLKAEIERIDSARTKKEATRDAAQKFFK